MTITIEIIEQPNGDVAVGIKSKPQAGTAMETQYYDTLTAALRECVIPSIIKNIGGKIVKVDDRRQKPGDN